MPNETDTTELPETVEEWKQALHIMQRARRELSELWVKSLEDIDSDLAEVERARDLVDSAICEYIGYAK